jgi:branched-chain amino acid aminotransferase
MRLTVIELAKKMKYIVSETSLEITDLLEADEVFLTNAIKGIEWIGAYKQRRYFNTIASKLRNELVQLVLCYTKTS